MDRTDAYEAYSKDKIKRAEQCLIDNGIEPDEAETVLQALGYILLGKELYPEEPAMQDCDINVAIEVSGGMVQNVWADGNVYVEVYDLDVSDFPDDGEEEEAYDKQSELNRLINGPGWKGVW